MVQPTVEVATFVIHDGKLLLGKDENGKWRVPGGVINTFETCEKAAQRTFIEATGVGIKAEHILFVSEDIDNPARHRIVVYAYGQYLQGEISEKIPTYTDIQWVDVRELGPLQNGMTDDVIDAMFKFSLCLKAMNPNRKSQA